jgi:hypothetical protein
MTQAQAQARLRGKACAICGRPATANDHDHLTGKLRDPLCHPCNSGLGMFGDDVDRLLTAAAYLTRHLA